MATEIRNVIFDVGMVLIDFCWEKHCRRLGFADPVIRTFDERMVHSQHWSSLDEGSIEEQDAIRMFQQEMPEYAEEISKFWEQAQGLVEEYPYAAPVVDELHRKGYRVYLLSNYPLHMYEIHWPTFTFFPKVDGYVVSAVERMKKPDPAIYRCLTERYHLRAEECLFVDDRQENVDTALHLGMQGVRFTGMSALQAQCGIFRDMSLPKEGDANAADYK